MIKLTLNQYQTEAMRTASGMCEKCNDNLILNGAMGLNGEAGEVADKVKKVIRDTVLSIDANGAIVLSHDNRIELAKEIGDVLWYCATLANDLGMKLGDVAQMNINKLKSGQERGKLSGSGDNR